jgi:hypothetical protein
LPARHRRASTGRLITAAAITEAMSRPSTRRAWSALVELSRAPGARLLRTDGIRRAWKAGARPSHACWAAARPAEPSGRVLATRYARHHAAHGLRHESVQQGLIRPGWPGRIWPRGETRANVRAWGVLNVCPMSRGTPRQRGSTCTHRTSSAGAGWEGATSSSVRRRSRHEDSADDAALHGSHRATHGRVGSSEADRLEAADDPPAIPIDVPVETGSSLMARCRTIARGYRSRSNASRTSGTGVSVAQRSTSARKVGSSAGLTVSSEATVPPTLEGRCCRDRDVSRRDRFRPVAAGTARPSDREHDGAATP